MREPARSLFLSRGSGLLDALVALAILTFGLLAMSRFQGRMVAQATETQTRQTASQFAGELLSTALVDTANAACYTLPQAGTCNNDGAKTRTTDWSNRTKAALPGTATTSSTLDATTGRLRVVITWVGKDSSDTHTLDVTTDVRN